MKKSVHAETDSAPRKASVKLGLVLCVIFSFTLICNLTLIVKGTIFPDRPPSVLGKTPVAVLSDSMSGDAPDHIENGDLILVKKAEAESLKTGDIISFMYGDKVWTHRITDIETTDSGELLFYTRGDANIEADPAPVRQEDLIGICVFRIPKLGAAAVFMQTPLGMSVFIGIPAVAFVIYDIFRRQRSKTEE